jgi:DnaJ-class molecular chaperone
MTTSPIPAQNTNPRLVGEPVKRSKRGPECPDCHGYGYPLNRKGEDCKRCHGEGYLGAVKWQ